jgi:hypothetical protein
MRAVSECKFKTERFAMRSITREQLEHLGDPVAEMVWRLWIKKGEAQLLETPAGNRKEQIKPL